MSKPAAFKNLLPHHAMPIQCNTPHLNIKCTLLYSLEKATLRHMDADVMLGALLRFWLERRRLRICFADGMGEGSTGAWLVQARPFQHKLMGLWLMWELNYFIPHTSVLSLMGSSELPMNSQQQSFLSSSNVSTLTSFSFWLV